MILWLSLAFSIGAGEFYIASVLDRDTASFYDKIVGHNLQYKMTFVKSRDTLSDSRNMQKNEKMSE